MHHFTYRDGALHAEGVPLARIAAEVGTPVYVYSTATLERHYRAFAAAFNGQRAHVFYAMKANSNLAVLATLARLGAGAATVSEGEIRKALAAGIPASKIVFSGVGKTETELAYAVDAGIHQVNVESAGELHALARIAAAKGKRQATAIRVNPDVGAGGHAKITTGSAANKFGVSHGDAERLYAAAVSLPGVRMSGSPATSAARSGNSPISKPRSAACATSPNACAARATRSSGSTSAAGSASPTRWRKRRATAPS